MTTNLTPEEIGQRAHGVLHWLSAHSGVPIVIVAAVLLVVAWKLFRLGVKLVVPVAVVAAMLLLATKLGWIAF